MPSCPHCQAALPSFPERYCLNCGGDLELPAPAPVLETAEPPGVGASVEAGSPPSSQGASGVEGVPWERKRELGFATALVESTGQVLFSPVQFFSKMAGSEGIGSLLAYAVLVGYAAVLVDTLYGLVFQMVAGSGTWSGFGRGGELERLLPWALGTGGLLMRLLVGPIVLAVGTMLKAGVFHLCLLLVGGARRGFEMTFGVVAYTTAADLFALIPLCGGLGGLVYGLVLTGIGLAHAHRTSGGKAAAAVLLPLSLACCCCAVVAILFGSSIAALVKGLE